MQTTAPQSIPNLLNIVQTNISRGYRWIWSFFRVLPQLTSVRMNTSPNFANFLVGLGAMTFLGGSAALMRAAHQASLQRGTSLTPRILQSKYGNFSWAFIPDVRQLQAQCIYLAQQGFKLILGGSQTDITLCQQLVKNAAGQGTSIHLMPIDWRQDQTNHELYKNLLSELEHFDISILVLPRIHRIQQRLLPLTEQALPDYHHIYLLLRYFGPKLKFRSYMSAFILPSLHPIDMVGEGNAMQSSLMAGFEALAKTLRFEWQHTLEIIIMRGEIKNVFQVLGKVDISM